MALGLVDGHILDTLLRRRVLAGVRLASPRHRVLCLLSCCALKEHVQLVVGATRLGHHRLWEFLEQSRCGSNILTCPSEEWGSLAIFVDPPVYVISVGACGSIASAMSDLVLEFGVLLL
jgi:hypothetical protein